MKISTLIVQVLNILQKHFNFDSTFCQDLFHQKILKNQQKQLSTEKISLFNKISTICMLKIENDRKSSYFWLTLNKKSINSIDKFF